MRSTRKVTVVGVVSVVMVFGCGHGGLDWNRRESRGGCSLRDVKSGGDDESLFGCVLSQSTLQVY